MAAAAGVVLLKIPFFIGLTRAVKIVMDEPIKTGAVLDLSLNQNLLT
jgi:hypothetical protein